MDLTDLKRPFNAHQISWRVGRTNGEKGMALAYIDARDVMERLDLVCGPENWQCDYPWSDGSKVVCRIGIRINNEWIWKSNGAGDSSFEAEKGAMSDAFKRAAVLWGIGQYLYSCPNWWQPVTNKFFDKSSLSNLNKNYVEWIEDLKLKPINMVDLLVENTALVLQYSESILAIKTGIALMDLSSAQEEWAALDDEIKARLWRAPTKGGPFTTHEREIMKSKEFREANGTQ